MNRASRLFQGTLRNPLVVVLVVFLVGFAFWGLSTRTQPHHVYVAMDEAFNLAPGLDVKVNGIRAGKIAKVTYNDGQAVVKIGVYNNYWPLHVGTTLETRWGTSIGDGTRYLQLVPGPNNAPVVPDGGIISEKYTTPAVDLDQVFNVFNPPTRTAVQTLLSGLNGSLAGRSHEIGSGVAATAPALTSAQGLFADIAADRSGLKTLISNGDKLTKIIADRQSAVSDLVTVAARTLNVFAQNTNGVKNSIQQLPATLSDTRGTLSRLDTSIGYLRTLVSAIAPGARELPALAATAAPALNDLHRAVPATSRLVTNTTNAAPALSTFLQKGAPFMTDATTTLRDITPMVACIRPYAPEAGSGIEGLAGWFMPYALVPPHEGQLPGAPTPYDSRQASNGLAHDHDPRAQPIVASNSFHAYPSGIVTPVIYQDLLQQRYAFPRPPGLDEGQPYYLPQCGVTPDALNPAKAPKGDFG